ncbi:MAG TPA: MXAN_5187 C-terminal domain-containing protein [Polyangiaceae bacterium]|nr:MXAN_5187 C-terminal domain-containing protein [Polyangiaceae bacterium]
MNAEELDIQLSELEVRLERLRALYEQYFLGMEKVEPTVARKDVDRRIWTLRHENIRNTARRYKVQTLVQRYNTFQQYWQRICREIENGTYRRHLARAERIKGGDLLTIAARRRAGHFRKAVGDDSTRESEAPASLPPTSEAPPPASDAVTALPSRQALDTLDLDMGLFDGTAPKRPPPPRHAAGTRAVPPPAPQRPAQPPPPPPRRPAPAAPPPVPLAAAKTTDEARAAEPRAPATAANEARAARRGAQRSKGEGAQTPLSEERLRELHERLIDVKRKNNERGNVSLDKLTRSLRDAETQLRQKHGGRRIDFDVIVKNGKVVLKPIVR